MEANKNILAVGMENSTIEIWDTEKNQILRTYAGHSQRVSSLAWNSNILSSGSLDSSILNHDIRIKDHMVKEFRGHTKEV